MSNKVYIVGVGMSKFEKPGRRSDADYTDDALQAATKALLDANLTYDDVKYAAAGYCFGDSTSGQRALYQLGLTQIPIINVNNNCSTGSTALYTARQAVASGQVDCAMALGFEKMAAGSLAALWQDRTNPMDKTMEVMGELRGIGQAPFAPQIFANAGIEYLERNGGSAESMDWIAYKSHAHSTLNPYAQFRTRYTLDQVKGARKVFGPLTLLHCSPTSDGAGAAILASEDFVRRHNLGRQAIEIAAQVMATDSTAAFDPKGVSKSCLEVAGADMTRRAARDAYAQAGITASDVNVVELHDCFSANELVTYDALGLCEPGKAADFTLSGATTLPAFAPGKTPARRVIVNPSGGLISKGHPLGATGLAQCAELTWQLRGWAGDRQVPGARVALQHNIGLGGAVVVGIYRPASDHVAKAAPAPGAKPWVDARERFGYNPALECRPVRVADVRAVLSANGGLVGMPDKLVPEIQEKLEAPFKAGAKGGAAAATARL
ncbi:thiolase-like protein [Entophlyctis helioformis]|nr:thiolase-like protein [Entophlyctis helioformis]